MYSRWRTPRYALSQIIAPRQLLIDSIEERLDLINKGLDIIKKAGEPGCLPDGFLEKAAKWATSGASVQLQRYLDAYLKKFNSTTFSTKISNLDIRHGSNFTGPKRGKNRCYELPYWGKFKEIMKN